MNLPMPSPPDAALTLLDPFGFGRAAGRYWLDAFERSVLFIDVMRVRGNQYLEHIEKTKPSVLGFESEVLLDGHDLPRPVNYELLQILPPEGYPTDPQMRPFVVIDPRAGHGPGIGGFKPDSEIGVALRAGHPCYFIGFLPYPEPGQTVEDVVEAEIAFLRHVNERHDPRYNEKPMVVANCQAGWQIMMAASLEPDLFGPILIAGAPLSYWAGERGGAPMRYAGGMSGGSWATSLLSDLGAGQFDGAWLVQNFENLNPANTFWTKQYRLFANVDTEASRYLEFERWWGGHVVLGGDEIQYIVDNLFVGNRLSTAQMVTSDGRRIDLRNLRSPVVVFCSQGDDITPPHQALGWVRDLYEDVEDIITSEQTIVYCVHDTTGHLGIFVSGSVSRKEHAEFTANMDYIDVLPPGLYETTVTEAAQRDDAELIERDYLLEFQQRTIEELDQVVQHSPEDDTRFATVARISEINLGLYRLFVQPWVRALATPQSARWMRRMHPNRLGYRLLSDRNPLMTAIPVLAERIRADRHPVDEDNVFRALESITSAQITGGLDAWRDLRDGATERLFLDIFGQPLLQSLVGLGGDAHVHRRRPGSEPEHRRFVARRQAELREQIAKGNSHEAVIRALIFVLGGAPSTDERNFKRLRASHAELEPQLSVADFKRLMREQFFILKLDREAAVEALPSLLKGQFAEQIADHLEHIEHVLAASGELTEHSAERLVRVRGLFEQAIDKAPFVEAQSRAEAEEWVTSQARAQSLASSGVEEMMESQPAPAAATPEPKAAEAKEAEAKAAEAKAAEAKAAEAKAAEAKAAEAKAAEAKAAEAKAAEAKAAEAKAAEAKAAEAKAAEAKAAEAKAAEAKAAEAKAAEAKAAEAKAAEAKAAEAKAAEAKAAEAKAAEAKAAEAKAAGQGRRSQGRQQAKRPRQRSQGRRRQGR
jgi:pimeloyl-ACP methyl ester carboxylesterase